jgi:hypothetical protein
MKYYIPCFEENNQIMVRNFRPSTGFFRVDFRIMYLGESPVGEFEFFTSKSACLRSKTVFGERRRLKALEVTLDSKYSHNRIKEGKYGSGPWDMFTGVFSSVNGVIKDITSQFLLQPGDIPSFIPIIRQQQYMPRWHKNMEWKDVPEWLWKYTRNAQFCSGKEVVRKSIDKYFNNLFFITTPSILSNNTYEIISKHSSPIFSFGMYAHIEELVLIEDIQKLCNGSVLLEDCRTVSTLIKGLQFTNKYNGHLQDTKTS